MMMVAITTMVTDRAIIHPLDPCRVGSLRSAGCSPLTTVVAESDDPSLGRTEIFLSAEIFKTQQLRQILRTHRNYSEYNCYGCQNVRCALLEQAHTTINTTDAP